MERSKGSTLVDALAAPARQSRSLEATEHRPWPLPERPWLMGQTWEDLLFAHWRAPADALRRHLPPGLELDLYEGEAWLGLTPFRLSGLRARGLPPVPLVSSFLELNTRTYVTAHGKPGIWFFSLDASSVLAVEGARRIYKLPYFRADISAERRDGWIRYESGRRDRRGAPATFRARYRPSGAVFEAEPGSLEHFLTERYCLYTRDQGRLKRAEIHHEPWPLQLAEAAIEENTMPPRGIEPGGQEPLFHFSARLDIVVWSLSDV
jgi:uncharacterized protein YqjF (DUF2071 family)